MSFLFFFVSLKKLINIYDDWISLNYVVKNIIKVVYKKLVI